MKTAQLYTALLLATCLSLLAGCNPAPTPQRTVNLGVANVTLVQNGTAHIPVTLSAPSNQPITVHYSLRNVNGSPLTTYQHGADYKLHPGKLTFAPQQLTDTIHITNLSPNSTPVHAALFLDSVSAGATIGVLSFTQVHLYGGNSFALTFGTRKLDLWHDITAPIQLRTTKGSSVRSPFDIPCRYEVVPEQSTAQEGVHFSLPADHLATIAEGEKETTITLKQLKYEKEHSTVVLRLLPNEGFSLGRTPTVTIQLHPLVDFSGKWVYQEMTNRTDFLESGEAKELLIEGAPSDYIQVSGTPQKFTLQCHFTSKLRHIFPNTIKAYHLHDQTYRSFSTKGGLPVMHTYVLDPLNARVSASAQEMRPTRVGWVYAPRNDAEYLYLVLYDMHPLDSFKVMYDFMADGSQYPMLSWPPLYLFKKVQ